MDKLERLEAGVSDVDSLPWDGAAPATGNGAKGRRCVRHSWVWDGVPAAPPRQVCARCGKEKDAATSRRGRTARNRGNDYEREVARILGGRRVGQYGDKVDVDVPGYLRVQCKVGASYPERLDGWLRAIPQEAGILRAVVIGDAPGAGRRRRSLIVLDLDEYASWHAGGPSDDVA
jgi:hypothetical protein